MARKPYYRTGPSLKVTLGIPLAIAAFGALGVWLMQDIPQLREPFILMTALLLIGAVALTRLLAPSSVEYIREVHDPVK